MKWIAGMDNRVEEIPVTRSAESVTSIRYSTLVRLSRGCKKYLHITAVALVVGLTSGCAYLSTLVSQTGLSVKQELIPRQRNLKHMLHRRSFFVYGRLTLDPTAYREPTAVIAVFDPYGASEVVDVNQQVAIGSYFGLNLPEGHYILYAVVDRNRKGRYEVAEVIGQRAVSLSEAAFPGRVVGEQDIELSSSRSGPRALDVPVKTSIPLQQSLFYPGGTIRSLNDPIFSPHLAAVGLYKPSAFMETAPMLFYALEEDLPYKIPVVFVHGIEGSPRSFQAILDRLDRSRYRPWFYYYPSGMTLEQTASMFYEIFLSGKLVPVGDMPIAIVAHSMGGVVVREALNHLRGKGEAKVSALVTLASPLGGHPSARGAESAPVVIPSWRDINPDSDFIGRLYRRPLPQSTSYHLFSAVGLEPAKSWQQKTDGVVPLLYQLQPLAVAEAAHARSFPTSHTGILSDERVIKQVLSVLAAVKNPYPEPHLKLLSKGGFNLPLGDRYTRFEQYAIDNFGYYLRALATNEITPSNETEKEFVQAAQGRSAATLPVHSAWVKFTEDYPNWQSLR